MEVQSMWMVVVTYPEWLNWIAWGHLRLNTRIGRVTGPEDVAGFAQLMHRCPDLRVDDEQAFVLARLKPQFRSLLEDVPGSTVPEVANLSLQAVSEFLPVTARAARLLEADAHRARARLSAPLFEAAWAQWATQRKEADAHRRGQALASVLGIPEVDLTQIPQSIQPYLTGGVPPPNVDRLDKLKGSRAYGWGAAFGLLEPLAGEKHKRQLIRDFELTTIVESRRHDYSLTTPILDDALGLAQAAKLEEGLLTQLGVDVSVKQLVTFWHYEQLIKNGKNVSLESLVLDMATLVVSGPTSTAANAAYFIGRLMDDAAVTSLLYSANPSDWPAIAPAAVQFDSLDVMKAAARLRQQQAPVSRALELQVGVPHGAADSAVQLPASGGAITSTVDCAATDPKSIVQVDPSDATAAPADIDPAIKASNSGELVASDLSQPPAPAEESAAQPEEVAPVFSSDVVLGLTLDAQAPHANPSPNGAAVGGATGELFEGSLLTPTEDGPTPANVEPNRPSPPPDIARRADFHVGNRVTFVDKKPPHRVGMIVRVNPKTATLDCDGEKLRITFEQLRHLVDE